MAEYIYYFYGLQHFTDSFYRFISQVWWNSLYRFSHGNIDETQNSTKALFYVLHADL